MVNQKNTREYLMLGKIYYDIKIITLKNDFHVIVVLIWTIHSTK